MTGTPDKCPYLQDGQPVDLLTVAVNLTYYHC